MIPQDVIEQVKQHSDIAEVVGSYVRLKKRGRHFEGLCPFHTEKTPSFKVSPERQTFHCFGCSKGGNVFTFLMEHERMSFIESVKYLADKAGIVIRDSFKPEARELNERLQFAHECAVEYFESLLVRPAFSSVLDQYLLKTRALSRDTIAHFHVGVAGEDWDGLLKFCAAKGITADDLVTGGLAIRGDKGVFDRFRLRLMIPIYSLSSKPIAFGGRTLKKGEHIKYMNSPETPLYSKGNLLYGLDQSREAIRAKNQAIIVEGYFDLMSLWQAGVQNVVASSGTAFTATQARLLARFADEVILFFDADQAGQAAVVRSVQVLYDAGLNVKVASAPKGDDPDSVARKSGSDGIEKIISASREYLSFRLDQVGASVREIKIREQLVREFRTIGQGITDPTRRIILYQSAADSLNVPLLLFTEGGTISEQTRLTPRLNKPPAVERDLISLLLSDSHLISSVHEQIAIADFEHLGLGRLYGALLQQYRDIGSVDPASLVQRLADDESISLLTGLTGMEWDTSLTQEQLVLLLGEMKSRQQRRIREQLKIELADAEAHGNNDLARELTRALEQHGLRHAS